MKKYIAGSMFLIVFLILSGCSNQVPDFSGQEDSTKGNPFEEKNNMQVMATISHGVVNKENMVIHLKYEGGEMAVPYEASATGIAESCGFLLYVNGIPQPYRLETDTDYQYLHTSKLNEENTQFTFSFVPVAGKKGDELEICVASILNPMFQPDLVNTFSYGYAHKMLAMSYPVTFFKESPEIDYRMKQDSVAGDQLVASSNEITQEKIKEHENNGLTVSLEDDVYTDLYLDDKNMLLDEWYNLADRAALHVRYQMFGQPGIRYKTTFYINHVPIALEDGKAFECELSAGNLEAIEFDLDTNELPEKCTFYAVSVPCNTEEFPDDAIVTYKTNSILLFKE